MTYSRFKSPRTIGTNYRRSTSFGIAVCVIRTYTEDRVPHKDILALPMDDAKSFKWYLREKWFALSDVSRSYNEAQFSTTSLLYKTTSRMKRGSRWYDLADSFSSIIMYITWTFFHTWNVNHLEYLLHFSLQVSTESKAMWPSNCYLLKKERKKSCISLFHYLNTPTYDSFRFAKTQSLDIDWCTLQL